MKHREEYMHKSAQTKEQTKDQTLSQGRFHDKTKTLVGIAFKTKL